MRDPAVIRRGLDVAIELEGYRAEHPGTLRVGCARASGAASRTATTARCRSCSQYPSRSVVAFKPQEVIESAKERGHSLTSWRRFDFASSMISSPSPERIVLVV